MSGSGAAGDPLALSSIEYLVRLDVYKRHSASDPHFQHVCMYERVLANETTACVAIVIADLHSYAHAACTALLQQGMSNILCTAADLADQTARAGPKKRIHHERNSSSSGKQAGNKYRHAKEGDQVRIPYTAQSAAMKQQPTSKGRIAETIQCFCAQAPPECGGPSAQGRH